MLTTQRKHELLTRLRRDGKLVAKDLSIEMKVSEDTIRRDLRELAKSGLLQRVHGGALPSSPAVANFAGREEIRNEGKTAIGRAAAAMIQPGQVVLLDGGTTAREIARHLPADLHATVITHSPTIALALVPHKHVEVVLLGGRLFKHSVVAMGAACFEAISRVKADIFFLGVTGLHPETGFTTGDFEEAAIKRALSHAAAETYVLASAEKWNTASPYLVLGLDEVTGIITEQNIKPAILRPFAKRGLTIVQGR
jgi:DeoR/GlpR family transcriptional regulator of sugar metabolism